MDLNNLDEVGRVGGQRVTERRKREQFNISFGPEEFERFEGLAERLHIPPSTLARAWILQRLDQELGLTG